MIKRNVSVADDFSVYPGGRSPIDGPFSGEEFRQKFLEPALKASTVITVDLDGTRGYGSSFLEEAFGGLVRLNYSKQDIRTYIKIKSSRESYIKEIELHIERARSDQL